MWKTLETNIQPNIVLYRISHRGAFLSFREVLSLWQEDASFRDYFIQLLQGSLFEGYFFECIPIRKDQLDRVFEFVLYQTTAFGRLETDFRSFANQFRGPESAPGIQVFPNLGRNAILVVPRPVSKENCYTHLALFLRNGPKDQIHQFWIEAGKAVEAELSDRWLWLSTSGLGVYYLHLRLDQRPKYYQYQPYKRV